MQLIATIYQYETFSINIRTMADGISYNHKSD